VKAVTTLDVLSGGRAYFGLGAGWFEREADCLGFPLPGTWKERFERLEETLQIAHRMLRDDRSPYEGKYYQLSEPINHPLPLSQPRIPILIGGEGSAPCGWWPGTQMRVISLWGRPWKIYQMVCALAMKMGWTFCVTS
jgi:alkanesulfonate monooxygenase SsuD/methylene tetrahydromethanopterin reductase-like flavin-dependent oxidoreductase (luciferase family)